MRLNAAQRRGVDHRGGPLLLLAGAGTGKTRVITHRVAALVAEGVPAWRVLAVTFTNKAAREMRERIDGLCPELSDRRDLWIGTFHAIGARILRRHAEAVGLSPRFSIYDTSDQRTLMNRVLRDQRVRDKATSGNWVLALIDRASHAGRGAEALDEWIDEPQRTIAKDAWAEYVRRLRADDAVDFGDLLTLPVRLLEGRDVGSHAEAIAQLRRRFEHVVVDEYQDTNPVQARFVELLSERAELCVVGDDDQSIYAWRGADVAQILEFPRRHPECEVIRLEQNYRSTMHILACADAVIRRNRDRLGKVLFSELGDGERVRVLCMADERQEARLVAGEIADMLDDEGVEPDSLAVFYRTHAQSRPLEEALRRANIPYRIVGGTRFFDRAEVKDLLAWLRLLSRTPADLDVARAIQSPARGIGDKTLETVAAFAAAQGVSLWEGLGRVGEVGVGAAARKRVAEFVELVRALITEIRALDPASAADHVLDRTGLREAFARVDDDERTTRLENLQELIGSLEIFADEAPEATLLDFLDDVALATDVETRRDQPAVSLMTVHSAKGLEFEAVWVTGMEERVFPHVRALDDPEQMEEERRLAYVAITRAKRRLSLLWASMRTLWGQQQFHERPSRFVMDLPRDRVDWIGERSRSPATRPDRRGAGDEPGRRQAREFDEFAVEPTDDEPGVSLYVGMTIRHTTFGRGELVGWSGFGRDLKLVIRFGGAQRTILARYCEAEG